MTRETKIGLLVGLAFIIVIGILLSDHLTSSTEPPPAALTSSGNSVLGTVRSPGVGQSAIVTNVRIPSAQPQRTVPTKRETQEPTQPGEIVKMSIGGPSAGAQTQSQNQNQYAPVQTQTPLEAASAAISVAKPVAAEPIRVNQQFTQAPAEQRQSDAQATDVGNNAIAQIARAHGETIVSTTPGGQAAGTKANATSGMREYVAEQGDSLSKMAAKFYGTSTKPGRDAIVAANASLASDPNKVIVGKSYRIPALPSAPPQPQQAAAIVVPPAAPQQKQPQQAQPKSSANENWYVVQTGDTLTRIARDQLGDAGAIAAIVELNRETLKDPNNLAVNMKLRLPGKSVAQAN